ncbi:HipA domain-containing protein [Undibacterium sp. FT79W]|uniref:type II toxin-antitoxin system HipA family toxin n=1 Tax=Undibacterium sp. FT79W TaxID=2762296 RepID=UPI00164C89EE|nr:HipA domain-containing protein [Undibacterium sp. FT79W]MBC3879541.1 HipA domain-containing protein [Undibacterium sp. FT79W]
MPIRECTIFDCTEPKNPRPMAAFALDDAGNGHLGYGRHYITTPKAFPIDPLQLPLGPDPHLVTRFSDGSYGALSDAGPNAWGQKLTASLCKSDMKPIPATPVEWFLQSWHFGSGCLGFGLSHQAPPNIGIQASSVSDLSSRILSQIDKVVENGDGDLDLEARQLLAPGSSLGGLRPKTLVMHEGREYIAKFSRPDDFFDVPKAEYATLRMAHLAKIKVPDFELIDVAGKSVLIICRFDRTDDGKRLHYLSAHSVLGINSVTPELYVTKFSYAGFAESLRQRTKFAREDSHELFRRMAFNVLTGNIDDHLRNHALIRDLNGIYRLSPAFDLVPHREASNLHHSIGIGAQGPVASIENVLSQAGRFLLPPQEAKLIVEEVREVVSHWPKMMQEAGLTRSDVLKLKSSFEIVDAYTKPLVSGIAAPESCASIRPK